MSSAYGTTMDTMQTAAQQVMSVAEQIQAQLNQLNNEIEPVFSSWQGQGAASFQALHQRWLDDAQQIQTVLTQISEGIQLNATQYTAAEEAATTQMNTTASQL